MRAFALASEVENPRFILVGVPMDLTETYRKGAAKGPSAYRFASASIETYSLRLGRDLEHIGLADDGDLLGIVNVEEGRKTLESKVLHILTRKAFPVFIGGEHTLTLGVLGGLKSRYPDLKVVILDAHFDLRDTYPVEGNEKVNHATWARRAAEILGDGSMAFFGVRSGIPEEVAYTRAHHFPWFSEVELRPLEEFIGRQPVYLSIDIDVLDPSLCPGTSNPEPNGLSYANVLKVLDLMAGYHLVGLDLVELNPEMDAGEITSVVAASLVREALLSIAGRRLT